MISDEKIKALIGHEFPGGEYTVKHWENFLFTDCTGVKPMQNNVVHPSSLFHVPILGSNTTVTEMMEIGHAEGPDKIQIESYEWDWFHPLKEDVAYKVTGKITEAERCKGEMGNIFDRIQFFFELFNPEGELTARSVITWFYMRERWQEKLMMASMPFMIWMKKLLPKPLRTGFESLMLKMAMIGVKKIFPRYTMGK